MAGRKKTDSQPQQPQEAPTAVGPYGAKGIGEPALVPTAAAILNAIHHATGVRIRQAPATPDVVRVALAAHNSPSARR